MTMQLTLNADGTVSTLSLLAEVNKARIAAGEPTIEPRHFVTKVLDELDLSEDNVKTLRNPQGGRPAKYVDLTEDQAKQVAMRESKAVRKWVVAELNRLYAKAEEKPKSMEEMTADVIRYWQAQSAKKDQKIRDRALRGVLMTPSELMHEFCVQFKCKRVGGSRGAQYINMRLENAGLQVRSRNARGQNVYTPTEKGQMYAMAVTNVGLRWDTSVVDLLVGDAV